MEFKFLWKRKNTEEKTEEKERFCRSPSGWDGYRLGHWFIDSVEERDRCGRLLPSQLSVPRQQETNCQRHDFSRSFGGIALLLVNSHRPGDITQEQINQKTKRKKKTQATKASNYRKSFRVHSNERLVCLSTFSSTGESVASTVSVLPRAGS